MRKKTNPIVFMTILAVCTCILFIGCGLGETANASEKVETSDGGITEKAVQKAAASCRHQYEMVSSSSSHSSTNHVFDYWLRCFLCGIYVHQVSNGGQINWIWQRWDNVNQHDYHNWIREYKCSQSGCNYSYQTTTAESHDYSDPRTPNWCIECGYTRWY